MGTKLPDYADPMWSAYDADLRKILLTCDGQGKQTKEAALNELLKRAKQKS